MPYLGRVCTANKAVDHLHGLVDVFKLHKSLVLDGTCVESDAHNPAKRLAQLPYILLCRVRREVPYMKYLCRRHHNGVM